MKEFKLFFYDDNKGYGENYQKVWSDNEDEKVSFSVYDLTDYPEDAVIGRDLFTGYDFIEAIKLGFRIAKRGYDEIVVEDKFPED